VKTEQLVDALVADRRSAGGRLARSLGLALAVGGAVSLVVFALALGPRVDLAAALVTWRFELKVGLMLLAVVLAFGLCLDCARPDMSAHPLRRLLPLALVAVAVIAIELVVVPRQAWPARLVGTNSMVCLAAIPALAVAPLMAALAMLRRGAPASPALAGAAAGLLAAVSAASLYAFHCFDDSPLFVATWYTLAAMPVVAVGAVAGSRLLRW
jgi:hypothetical protein